MTNSLMVKIVMTFVLVNFFGLAYCETSNRQFWYSRYGPSGYRRQLFEGNMLSGELSLVQCSRFCSDDRKCKALQFYKTDMKIGKCYIFYSYTYNTAMIPSPGHLYMEKRNCLEPIHFTAVIMYPGDKVVVLFSPMYTYVFAVIVVANGTSKYTTLKLSKASPHNLIFPGLIGDVDGAFVGPLGNTFLVQENRLRCYSPVNPDKTLFEVCTTNAVVEDILVKYFAFQPRLDGVVSVDDTSATLYVMKDNAVHQLLWSGSVYDIISSFSISDVDNGLNIWSNAPHEMTAISRFLKTDTYLLAEDTKLMLYNSATRLVSSIFRMC